jgi:NAD+ kinase
MSKLIVLCPNPYRDCGLELTRKAKEILICNGYDVAVCPVFGAHDSSVIPDDVELSSWSSVSGHASVFIVIGGDGTILHTARYLNHSDIPMLGINLGTKGFMASLEPENIDLILDAAAGKYSSSFRMMIDIELIRNGEVIYTDVGLNDAVIHGMGDCIKLTAWCDSERIMSYSGDGIIVSTPTGSTGYSMSAGGPIVEPEAKNFIVSPICAHYIGSRSFVLSSDHKITIKAEKLHDRRAYVSVDGTDGFELANEDIIVVSKSSKCANLIYLGERSFYDSTFSKLQYRVD